MLTLLFDIDDTLYDRFSPFEPAYRRLFQNRFPLELRPLFLQFLKRGNEILSDAMEGRMTMEQMYILRFQRAMADFGAVITPQEALEFQHLYAKEQTRISISPHLAEALEFCSRYPVFLGIITNGPTSHQLDKYRTLGAACWIPEDHVLTSGEVGANKPDIRVFETAARRWGLTPEHTWYIGDSYEHDIEGAKNMNWHTIWLDRNRSSRTSGSSPCGEPFRDCAPASVFSEAFPAADRIAYTDADLAVLVRQLVSSQP